MNKARQAFNMLRFAAGAHRPTQGPLKATWEVTFRCNMRCKHCHLWQVSEHNDLSTEEGKAFIDDLARLGTLHLSFSGGEPFLREDMYELAEYAHSAGLTTAANTNGSRLGTPEAARRVCQAGMGALFISLDGPDAETHNALRGRPHAFDAAIRAIDNIVEQREGNTPLVYVNTTVTRDNLDKVEQIMMLAREHGADGMTMSILQDIGKYSPEEQVSIDGDTSSLGRKLRALVEKSNGMIPHMPEYLDNFETYLRNPNELYKYRCVAGYLTVLIHPDGEVHPCVVGFARMGSLREKPFREIWFSEEADRVRERIKANRHPICWFDCVAPINILLHNVRTLRVDRLLHRRTLEHIIKKTAR